MQSSGEDPFLASSRLICKVLPIIMDFAFIRRTGSVETCQIHLFFLPNLWNAKTDFQKQLPKNICTRCFDCSKCTYRRLGTQVPAQGAGIGTVGRYRYRLSTYLLYLWVLGNYQCFGSGSGWIRIQIAAWKRIHQVKFSKKYLKNYRVPVPVPYKNICFIKYRVGTVLYVPTFLVNKKKISPFFQGL